ncbi:MAG: hypothetical protein J0L84_11735 [Verrucomicrobia bacterium]|nr:hypothetical protein [Verrucomicrobiota bacterium]
MNSVKILAAWFLVGLPLAWGVFHSVQRSLPLFRGAPPTPAAVAPR